MYSFKAILMLEKEISRQDKEGRRKIKMMKYNKKKANK